MNKICSDLCSDIEGRFINVETTSMVPIYNAYFEKVIEGSYF